MSPYMKISVVIPARNEEAAIVPLLESLAAQERRPDEVIVVDAGSSDATAAVANKFNAPGFPVKVLRAGEALPGRARNLGLAAAAFEIVAMTDSGCVAAPQWLMRLAAPLESAEADYVFGAYRLAPVGFAGKMAAAAYFSVPNRVYEGARLRVGSFTSFAALRSALKACPGFSEELRAGEDTLMVKNLGSGGLRGMEVPSARVDLVVDAPFPAMLNKAALYASCRAAAGINTGYFLRLLAFYAVLLACVAAGAGLIFAAGLICAAAVLRAAKRIYKFEEGVVSGLGLAGFCGVCLMIPLVDAALLAGALRGFVSRSWK